MKAKTVNGFLMNEQTILPRSTEITIRVEKTAFKGQELTTLSLADDKRGIMLQVNYDDVKELMKRL